MVKKNSFSIVTTDESRSRRGGGLRRQRILKGEKLEKTSRGKILRIPRKNLLPNRKVEMKEMDGRGKHSLKAAQERTRLDIENGRRVRNSSNFSVDYCKNCNSFADDSFIRTDQYDVVCKKCGVVQDGDIFYEGQIVTLSKSPSTNKKVSYLRERCRLLANREPRICAEDIKIIRRFYGTLNQNWFVNRVVHQGNEDRAIVKVLRSDERRTKLERAIEDPAYLSKSIIHFLLRCIDQFEPSSELRKSSRTKSFAKKYGERWLQIKIYLYGFGKGEKDFEEYITALPTTSELEEIHQWGTKIIDFYEARRDDISSSKKNMLSLDLMFLLILYNLNLLQKFGWYFVTKHMHKHYYVNLPVKKSKINQSLEKDLIGFAQIFDQSIALKEKGFIVPKEGISELVKIAADNKAYIF